MDAIAIIEDDSSMYDRIIPYLPQLGIPVERAINRVEAFWLLKKYETRAFWIVDGIFPKFPDSRSLDLLWPEFIRRLQRTYESEKTHIVWLTSDVDVFKGVGVPTFSKEYLEESMKKIALLIQQAHHETNANSYLSDGGCFTLKIENALHAPK